MTDADVMAVYVPAHVVDDAKWRRHAARLLGCDSIDGLCCHERPTATGRWVCVLDAGHEGEHG